MAGEQGEQDTLSLLSGGNGSLLPWRAGRSGRESKRSYQALQYPVEPGSMRLRLDQAKHRAGLLGTKKDDINLVRGF